MYEKLKKTAQCLFELFDLSERDVEPATLDPKTRN